jgi:hypothetical protein
MGQNRGQAFESSISYLSWPHTSFSNGESQNRRPDPNCFHFPQRHHVPILNEHIIAAAHEAVFANLLSKDIEKAFNETTPGANTAVTILDAEEYK